MIELFFKNKTAVNMAAPSTGQFFQPLVQLIQLSIFTYFLYTCIRVNIKPRFARQASPTSRCARYLIMYMKLSFT